MQVYFLHPRYQEVTVPHKKEEECKIRSTYAVNCKKGRKKQVTILQFGVNKILGGKEVLVFIISVTTYLVFYVWQF